MNKKYFLSDDILDNFRFAIFLISSFFLAGVLLTFVANGTSGEGDSIMHYQFAKYAPKHHELFFDHWAKPLFVLLASPFAQFGFKAMQIFNLLLSSVAVFITWRMALLLKVKRSVLSILFLILSPGLIYHSISGFTEPLFALILVTSIFLILKEKYVASLLIISFLPFVRSEGLIICGVFGLLLLLEKRFFLIPLLLVGHAVYSIAGYPVHKNLLWIFTKIPYAKLSSTYGKGTWGEFFIRLPEIIGLPLYALLIIGMIAMLLKGITLKKNLRELVLVYGCFIAYFFAHVIFWALGIFNSMGLTRPLIAVLPLMSLIELRGINQLAEIIPVAKTRVFVVSMLLLCIIIFPFTKTKYAWNYQRNFCLNATQRPQEKMANYIKQNFPDYKDYRYYYDANYVAVIMNIDYFDTTASRRTWEIWECPPTAKSFVIWDEWYSVVEMKVPLIQLTSDDRFEMVKEFIEIDEWGYEKKTVLFKSKKDYSMRL